MKKILSYILCGLLFCLLLVCACGPVSDFDRTVEEDQFSVDCTVLNTTLSEQYALEEGDLVVVSHSENGGKFAFQIGISGIADLYRRQQCSGAVYGAYFAERDLYALRDRGTGKGNGYFPYYAVKMRCRRMQYVTFAAL